MLHLSDTAIFLVLICFCCVLFVFFFFILFKFTVLCRFFVFDIVLLCSCFASVFALG